MPMIPLSIPGPRASPSTAAVDDYLWPSAEADPVVMMHGFAPQCAVSGTAGVPGRSPRAAGSHRARNCFGCGRSPISAGGRAASPRKTSAGQIVRRARMRMAPRPGALGRRILGREIIGGLARPAAHHQSGVASLVLCNTPGRISDEISGSNALDRGKRVGGDARLWRWRMVPPDPRLIGSIPSMPDTALCEWVIGEMDPDAPGRRGRAAGLPSKRSILRPRLPGFEIPVLLLSGDRSRIASSSSARRRDSAAWPDRAVRRLWHGVNLLQPNAAPALPLDFWRTIE